MPATDIGRAFAIARLLEAPDLASLRRVWDCLGTTYQRDPDIQEIKNKLKAKMEK